MKFRHPGVRLRSIYKENILNFEGSNNYKGRSIKSLLMRFLKKDYPRLKMISEFSELSLNSEKRSFSNFWNKKGEPPGLNPTLNQTVTLLIQTIYLLKYIYIPKRIQYPKKGILSFLAMFFYFSL